jgi:hypothetical protein
LLTLRAIKDLSGVSAHEGVEEGIEPALSLHLAGFGAQDSTQPLSFLSTSTYNQQTRNNIN